MPCILIVVTHLVFPMASQILTLYDPFKIDANLTKEQHHAQEMIYYGESHFRSILINYIQADIRKKVWMTKYIHKELVCHMELIYNEF